MTYVLSGRVDLSLAFGLYVCTYLHPGRGDYLAEAPGYHFHDELDINKVSQDGTYNSLVAFSMTSADGGSLLRTVAISLMFFGPMIGATFVNTFCRLEDVSTVT